MWMTDCPTSFTDSCLSDIKASRLIDLEYTSILIDLYCYRSGYNGNVDLRRPVRHDFFFWNLLRFPDTRFRRERWPISSINWSGVGRTLPFRVQWDVSCLDILRGLKPIDIRGWCGRFFLANISTFGITIGTIFSGFNWCSDRYRIFKAHSSKGWNPQSALPIAQWYICVIGWHEHEDRPML